MEKKNFKIGWLIFWIIILFPVAIWYYLSRSNGKSWFHKHPVWTGIIGFFLVMFVFGLFTPDQDTNTQQDTNQEESNNLQQECMPNWSCTSWSQCSSAKTQTRTCTDDDNCGILDNKPKELQSCIYEEPEDFELDDEMKKNLVTFLLESNPYDYSVIRVVVDYDKDLGNYASVGMLSTSTTELEVAEQLGAGIGALYGFWDDKDYYAVSFNNLVDICTFGVDGTTTKRFMNQEISDVELFLSIDSVCQPAT